MSDRPLRPQLYLWIAIAIFGSANSIIQLITRLGSQNLVNGRNPISLCNVLFVGNLCALLVFILLFSCEWRWRKLKILTLMQWGLMTVVSFLSGALAPGLIFESLTLTNVNNVILIGRLEPPLTLALSVWLLREQVNFWQSLGAIVAFSGVLLLVCLQPVQSDIVIGNFISLSWGEALAGIAVIAQVVATMISRLGLRPVPIGISLVFRTVMGTVIFFGMALYFYDIRHFGEAFSPFLWKWMLIYGPLVVVGGQCLWVKGLRSSAVSKAMFVSCFHPIAALLAAFLILRVAPTSAQMLGASVILVGIVLTQIGNSRNVKSMSTPIGTNDAEKIQDLESGMGFKGI